MSERPWVCARFACLGDISAAADTSFRIKELPVQKESHTLTCIAHTHKIYSKASVNVAASNLQTVW